MGLVLNKKIISELSWYSDEDGRTQDVLYYLSSAIAVKDSIGKDPWGKDGKVTYRQLYEDEEGNLYTVKELGKPVDVETAYREKTIASIKAKLTPAELELLNIK